MSDSCGAAQIGTPAHAIRSEQPGTSTAGLISASDDPQTLKAGQMSGKRPASQRQKTILRYHTEMILKLGDMFSQKQLVSIFNQVKMMEYVTARDMDDVDSIEKLCMALMRNGVIKHGEYSNLRKILVKCDVKAGKIINKFTGKIRQEREGPSPAKCSRPTGPVLQQSSEIHPDLKPLIGTAKAMIKREKEREFYTTKGFLHAKEKLLEKNVVVIKGNTGDGKTAIAIQLIHWLSQEQQAGQPLQIHNIEKLDLLEPNLKLITFIDDIFGVKDVCQKDVQEWDRRISHVKTLFVDKEANNFLVITIRNEIYNSLETCSCGTIFTDDHTIDLSSNKYKIDEEKKGLLELYKPKEFSWSDEERDKILSYAPNIGFPQCCQLFCNSVELQKERVGFFQNPFYFLNETLSKLQERSGLLYLFLNDGMIRVNDLDPNSKSVNNTKLEEAFDIKLFRGKYDSSKLTYKEKVTFVKESLEKLLGVLVVKEKRLFSDGDLVMMGKRWSHEDVYRFHHDSIYVAVALLYGKATPVGYIQNCPSKCLSYLTTSETATNKIVISSDHYKDMCERLLQEFEGKQWYRTCIGSLDVLKDPVFVNRFVCFLNERKVDKLSVLNKACKSGAEECVLYLLSGGVKPDKDTALSLFNRHWNDGNRKLCLLKEIVVYLNDETKFDVLNKACTSGAEECALYLLCEERVKPDEDTVIRVVEGRSVKLLSKLLEYDINVTARDARNNNNVLHKACLCRREDMVTLLCNTHPHLVHDTDVDGQTPLHYVAREGNVGLFQMMEKFVLNSLHRVENQQTKCESVDGRVVHKNCVCAQYMSQLVDGYGRTVLHCSCGDWLAGINREVCLYLCRSYPGLVPSVDKEGRYCLHYIAMSTSDVDMFTECETYLKQSVESTGGKYDVATILTSNRKSVLDLAKYRARRSGNNPLIEHLVKVFSK